MKLNNIFSKSVDCFFCYKQVSKNEAFTANVDTFEGRLAIKMCERCAKDFDDMMKTIEEIKNEGY